MYFCVLFSFAKDTSPVATQNGYTPLSREVCCCVTSFSLVCHKELK